MSEREFIDPRELDMMFDDFDRLLNPEGEAVMNVQAELAEEAEMNRQTSDIMAMLEANGYDQLACARQLYTSTTRSEREAMRYWQKALERLKGDLDDWNFEDSTSPDLRVRHIDAEKVIAVATSCAYDGPLASAAIARAADYIQPVGMQLAALSREQIFAEYARRCDGPDMRLLAAETKTWDAAMRELSEQIKEDIGAHAAQPVHDALLAETSSAIVTMGVDMAMVKWRQRHEVVSPAVARQMEVDREANNVLRKVGELCSIAGFSATADTMLKWATRVQEVSGHALARNADLSTLSAECREQLNRLFDDMQPIVTIPECFDESVYQSVLVWVTKQQFRDNLTVYYEQTGQTGRSQLYASQVIQNGVERAMIELEYGANPAVSPEKLRKFIDDATRDMLEFEITAGSSQPTNDRDAARLILSMIDRAYAEAKIFIECRREAPRE